MTTEHAPQRLWYPVDLLDEILPTGLSSAEAWFDPGMQRQLDEHEASYIRRHGPGDRIAFIWIEDRGTVELAINLDGTLNRPMHCRETPDLFGAPPPPPPDEIPADANVFWEAESETYAESAEEFAQLYADPYADGGILHVTVHVSHQSRAIHFEVGPDGRSLMQIEPLKQENTSC
jgi:hypothetical protein